MRSENSECSKAYSYETGRFVIFVDKFMPVITNVWAADPLGTAGMNYGTFIYIFGNFKFVPVHAVNADQRYSSTHSYLGTGWR